MKLGPARSLEEFRAKSAAVMASPRPTAEEALIMARQLVGSWPHGRADDPTTYGAAIASALREYPVAIGMECCDPRVGLAREREMMPTVVSVHEWCHGRMKLYRNVMVPKLAKP